MGENMNKYLVLTILVILVMSTITYTSNIGEKIEKYPVNEQYITISAEKNIYVNDCNGTDPFANGIKYYLMPYLLFGEPGVHSIHANYSISNPYLMNYNFTITYTTSPAGWYSTVTTTYTIYFRPSQANSEPVKIVPKVIRGDGSVLYPEVFYISGSWHPAYIYKWEITISTWVTTFPNGQAVGNYFVMESFEDISQIKNDQLVPLVYGYDNNLNFIRLNPTVTFTVNKINDTRIETILLIKFTDQNDLGKTIYRLYVKGGVLAIQFNNYFTIRTTEDTIEVRVYFNIVQQ